MDLSTLQSKARSLEASFDSWSNWLAFWTVLVVLGLVIEYQPDIAKAWKSRTLDWSTLPTVVGGFLITVGVAGELGVQFGSSTVEEQLRSIAHEVEARLGEEVARLSLAAKAAEARIAEAQKDAAKAIENTSLANERAETLRTDNLRLQSQINPRRLSRIITPSVVSLQALSDRTVRVSSYQLDVESALLATDIITMLQSLNFEVQDDRLGHMALRGMALAVHVFGRDDDLVTAARAVLLDSSIPSTIEPVAKEQITMLDAGFPEPDITIFVGPKQIQ